MVSLLEIRPRSVLSPEDLQKRCQIQTGLPLSVQAVRGCISQFYRSGAFQDVVVEAFQDENGKGVKLIFTFVEKERIGSLAVRGTGVFSAKKILTVAGLKPGIEYIRGDLPDMEQRVLLWYRQQGYLEANVRFEVRPLRRNRDVRLTLFIEEGPRAKVSRLIFTGEKVWDDEVLLSHMKTRVGKPYRRDLLEKDLEALVNAFIEHGYLHAVVGPLREDYVPGAAGVQVTIPVESGPHVEVLLDGNRAFDRDRLMKILNVYQEKDLDEIVLEGASRRLRDFYQQQGYYFAVVTYTQATVDPGHVRVHFQIDEGKPLSIRRISLEGNRFFSNREIRKTLRSRRNGFLLDDVVQKDVETIRALYQGEGFVDPVIQAGKEFGPDKTRVDLHFKVEEGRRVYIGRIFFEGNQVLSSETILPRLSSQEGQPYQESKAREDRYEIQSLYAQKGYIYAAVSFQSGFSFDGRYAILTYRIQEDQPVTMGNLYLRGNTFTRNSVILREVTLKRGDPFNYERILLDQRKIQRLGIFSEVRLDPVRPDVKENIKDLMLRVEEGKPGSVEFGLGYGDVERFRGSFQVVHSNLFGTGRQASFRVEGSSIEQKYTVGYKEPWFLGRSLDARVNLVDLIEDKTSFKRRTLGGSAGVEKKFGEHIHASLLYQYEDVALSDVQPDAVLTAEDTGKVRVATLNPSLVIDTRDDPFNPTSGAIYDVAYREAAKMLGAKPQFVKLSLQGNWFYSPLSRTVLAGSWRGGLAQNFGESKEVPIFERFFVGGRSTVRGYEQERLGIPGKTIIDGTPTGGNLMMVLNGEIRLSLPRDLGLVLFVDVGNVWDKVESFDPKEFRSTTGGGLRYNTPVGPLRLDTGCKMDREIGESRCVTHFTLGHAF